MARTPPEAEDSACGNSRSAAINPPPSDKAAPGVRELGPREFAAFISYSHHDIATARWLHRAIETYRVPRALVGLDGEYGPVPARLRPVFRDEDELAGATELGPKLEGALARSRALLVVCSPAARRSPWVDQEIRSFKRLNPGRPAFAVIAGGAPGEGDSGCFPEALLWEPGTDADHAIEPLAPDLQVLDRRVVKLKVIAGLLGVPYDRLHDREQRRRRAFAAVTSFAALVLIVVLSTLTLAAFSYARIALHERNAAEISRRIAIKERNDAVAARDLAERRTWLAQQAAEQIRNFVGQDCPPSGTGQNRRKPR